MAVQDGDALTSLKRQPKGDTLTEDDDGVFSAKVIYKCAWASVMALIPRRQITPHPDFPDLICEKSNVSRDAAGKVATIEVLYRGKPTEDPGGGGNPGGTGPIEESDASVSQEPITTHKDFDAFAVDGDNAVFSEAGVFEDFVKPTGAAEDLRGLENYFDPRETFSSTTTSSTKPAAASGVGKINTPTGAPPLDGARNWLKIRRRWRRSGGVYEITEQWMASGNKGWNDTVYETA